MCLPDPELQRAVQEGLEVVNPQSLCAMCPWDMAPEVVFPCGHGLCARDAWIQSGSKVYETLARLEECPVCNKPAVAELRLRPLQAGYRVATCDGGGTKAISEIVALQSIVKAEDMPRALEAHHYFDLVVGTSAGKVAPFLYRSPVLTTKLV